MFMPTVRIGKFTIGASYPCMIIAEAGVNHNGQMDLAHRLIDEAVQAGVDAVKFQAFVTEELVTHSAPKANYQLKTTGDSGSQFQMLKKLELTPDDHAELQSHCVSENILYLCTPYDTISVDMLDQLNVSAYKIASTDVTNIPFLQYVAKRNRPILLSTGMSNLAEVEMGYNAIYGINKNAELILLHCTSEYPTPVQEVNLRAITTLQHAFACPVGFSDHTPGIGASPWAVVLGASVIEKHFTLDKSLPGPDHKASLEPQELANLVSHIHDVELALGDGIKRPSPSEMANKQFMQKSIVARRPISAGQMITLEDVTSKRPGTGLSPQWTDRIVGRKASRAIATDESIQLRDIEW